MISTSREKNLQAKQEGDVDEASRFSKATSSSRQWSGFRNPRIVRVSRSFGGKDRHSKVCTIRGLRDRRIRLSVPTAIQLYDLQDRLGLSQPSKVIDWLLDATKHDIDKLPPLQIPQGFGQFHPQMFAAHDANASHQSSLSPFFDANFHSLLSNKEGIKINSVGEGEDQAMMEAKSSKYWDIEASLRAKSKEVERETILEKGKWFKTSDEQESNQHGIGDYSGQPSSAPKFFPIGNPSSLLNNSLPFNSYYHLDPSNLSLSQYGSHGYVATHAENTLNNNNSVSLPSSFGSQLFFCPPPATMPSLFPTYTQYVTTAAAAESDSRSQNNNFHQLLSSGSSSHQFLPNSLSISSSIKPFSLNVNHGLDHPQNNDQSHPDKDNTDS